MASYTKATNFTAKDGLPTGNAGKIVKGAEIDTELTAVSNAIASKADINSPTFTGTPAAPTASAGTNTTQVATTAFATGGITAFVSSTTTLTNKTLDLTNNTLTGTLAQFNTACSNADFVSIAGAETLTNKTLTTPSLTNPTVTTGSFANPDLTGVPTAPTASAGTNTTQLATTAFVTAAAQALYPVGSIYINATSSTNPATLLGFGTWTAFGAGRVLVGLDASDALFDTAEETGGSKDAVVVSHTHTFSGTTGDDSPDHTHNTHGAYGGGGNPGGSLNINNPGGQDLATSGASTRHQHSFSGTTASTGSSGTNANVQPFIVVRMWKRTA